MIRAFTIVAFSILLALILVGSALAQAGSGSIPAKGSGNLKLDENLFMLYVLESWYHNRLPSVPNDPVATIRVMRPDLARRQRILSELRTNLKNRMNEKKADLRLDGQLLTVFDAYSEELDYCKKEYADKGAASLAKFNNTMRIQLQNMSNNLAGTALAYGLMYYATEDNGVLVDGLIAYSKAAERNRQVTEQVQQAAFEQLQQEMKEITADLDKRKQTTAKDISRVAELTAALGKIYGWSKDEMAFDPSFDITRRDRSDQPRNPFIELEKARKLLNNAKDAKSEDILKQAQACLVAADLVPMPKVDPRKADPHVYDYFRASLYGQAGVLANLVAKKELGATGLSKLKKPADGGQLAAKAWNLYRATQPVATDLDNPGVLHHCVMANAYNAHILTAANLLQRLVVRDFRGFRLDNKTMNDLDPEHWYDYGCLLSITHNTKLSFDALKFAKQYGFKDFERADVNPDLDFVRATMTADFKKWLGK